MELKPDYLLLGFDSPISCLEFIFIKETENSTSKRGLVSGQQNGTIQIWNLKSRRVVYEKVGAHQSNAVLSVCTDSTAGDFLGLISQGRDGLVKQWKVNFRDGTWNEINSIRSISLNFCRLSTCQAHSLIFTPNEENSSTFDVYHHFNKLKFHLKPPISEVKYGMLVDSCSDINSEKSLIKLFGAYENGSIVIWLLNVVNMLKNNSLDESSTCKVIPKKLHDEVIITIDYNQNTNRGISGSADGKLCLWSINAASDTNDTPTLSLIKELKLGAGVGCARFRRDGRIVAVGMWDSSFKVFGGKKLKHLATIAHHDESISCLCFCGETKELAVASKDKIISVWSLYVDR